MQSTGSISDKILRGITHPNPPPAVPQIRHIHHGLLGGLNTICVSGGTSTPCYTQEGASADGINTVNLKVGARTSIGRHNALYIGFGHTVTHLHWYEEIVRAEYRYSF